MPEGRLQRTRAAYDYNDRGHALARIAEMNRRYDRAYAAEVRDLQARFAMPDWLKRQIERTAEAQRRTYERFASGDRVPDTERTE